MENEMGSINILEGDDKYTRKTIFLELLKANDHSADKHKWDDDTEWSLRK
jgi:hypothetical protein